MSTAMQTVPEGTLADRLATLEANQEKIIEAQNQIIELMNEFAQLANNFSGSIPAPLKAMLGM